MATIGGVVKDIWHVEDVAKKAQTTMEKDYLDETKYPNCPLRFLKMWHIKKEGNTWGEV